MMKFRKNKGQGFTMIELLVVLLIIGILAAVAAPMFLSNSDRAKASEAVAIAGSIRSAERTYRAQTGNYITSVSDGKSYFGTGGADQGKLGVLVHGHKYFSPKSVTISASSSGGAIATPQDFVILVDGANSEGLTVDSVDGARDAASVSAIKVQMDNSGATYYTQGTLDATNAVVWYAY